MRRAEGALELADRGLARAELARLLDDLDRLNGWFGGYALTLRHILRVTGTLPPGRRLIVVDIGGGRGDFAVRVVRWARDRGRAVRVVVLDRDADAMALARDRCAAYPEIVRVQGDATALPFRPASVDVIVSSLTLHHLEPEGAVTSLAEMGAAARAGLIVNDLLRSRMSLVLVWLVTRLLTRHPFARHDGPLSVRRAYSEGELRVLGEKAGLGRLAIRRYPLFARLVAWAP